MGVEQPACLPELGCDALPQVPDHLACLVLLQARPHTEAVGGLLDVRIEERHRAAV